MEDSHNGSLETDRFNHIVISKYDLRSCRGVEDEMAFQLLPTEIKDKIFKLLTFEEKRPLRLICKNWNEIITSHFVYNRPILVSHSNIKYIKNSVQPIRELLVRDMRRPFVFTNIKCGSTIRRMTFRYPGIIEQNLLWLLTGCPNLEILTFEESSLTKIKNPWCFRKIYLEYLTDLKIILDVDDKSSEGLQALLKVNSPSLKNVTILRNVEWNEFPRGEFKSYEKKVYQAFLRFLARHSKTIKRLNVDLLFAPDPAPNRPFLSKSCARPRPDLLASLGSVALEEFSSTRYQSVGDPNPCELTLLGAQKNTLIRLSLRYTCELKKFEYDLISANNESLRELRIDCGFFSWTNVIVSSKGKLDMECLKACKNLDALEVRNVYGFFNIESLPTSLRSLKLSELPRFLFLTNREILTVLGKLTNLECLHISGSDDRFDPSFPSSEGNTHLISLTSFRRILELPRLEKLFLQPVDLPNMQVFFLKLKGISRRIFDWTRSSLEISIDRERLEIT